MMASSFEIAPRVRVGPGEPLLVMAGPCVIEGEALCLDIASQLKQFCTELGLNYVFKASFDKANRTSLASFRGPGLDAGLSILEAVRKTLDVPVVTDVHEVHQVEAVARVADIIQIPAFLCRQTDLLLAAGRSGRVVNVKKGQFLAPAQIGPQVEKVHSVGNPRVMVTERGTGFGYENLVVDMRSLAIMRDLGFPVIFDATHSVQQPGGNGHSTGGERRFVPTLLRAAAAVGVDGFFLETHPDPDAALSDGPTCVPLDELRDLLDMGRAIHELVRSRATDPGDHL
jgi:2-dehydro-3-deoxyphosphooctonate aldolase (KDO 8-P synthase)